MKKILFFAVMCALCAACSSTPKEMGINAMPVKLTKAISNADLSCQTDADCVAVQKGCCMCAGYQAVNRLAAEKVQAVWEKSCKDAPCTREMCYVQITPKCEQNVCAGKLILPKGQN